MTAQRGEDETFDPRSELTAALMAAGLSGWTASELSIYLLPIVEAAEERGRAEVAAKVEALATAQEASSARWTEASGEADNDTDGAYFSGRAHAAEQAAIRLLALAAEVTR